MTGWSGVCIFRCSVPTFPAAIMSASGAKAALQAFHAWRRDLLLPGHATGCAAPDPELVLSSKMLRVFTALHPEYRQYVVELQLHFLEEDYTNRVKPDAWQEQLRGVSWES